jgi:acyl carrier protein
MSKNKLKILNDIFKFVFDDKFLKINRETSAKDIEEWDSLAQIRLIAAIEKKLKLRFNIKEVSNLKNVGEMVDLIEKKK